MKSAPCRSIVTFGLPESQWAAAAGPKVHLSERAARRASNAESAALAVGAMASRQQNTVTTRRGQRLIRRRAPRAIMGWSAMPRSGTAPDEGTPEHRPYILGTLPL